MTTYPIFAACLPGLETILCEELAEYSIGSERKVEAGGVAFQGSLQDVVKANRRSGVATLVRVEFTSMHVTKLAELDRKARTIPFRIWFRTRPRVRVRTRKSRLYHTGAIAERIGRSLDMQFGTQETELDPAAPELLIRLEKNRMRCSFNSSGEQLHRRGYRLAVGKAPLREDLARALLRVSWDRTSPLLDPLMGSGTLPIEAALMLCERTPVRRFAYEESPVFTDIDYVISSQSTSCDAPIITGSDRDEGAVEAAAANAERAGVRSFLAFECKTLSAAAWQRGLCVVTNPPYGKRIGKDVRPLLAKLGERVREHAGAFSCALPTGSSLSRATGLRLTSALMTDHGGLKIGFLRWNRTTSCDEVG